MTSSSLTTDGPGRISPARFAKSGFSVWTRPPQGFRPMVWVDPALGSPFGSENGIGSAWTWPCTVRVAVGPEDRKSVLWRCAGTKHVYPNDPIISDTSSGEAGNEPELCFFSPLPRMPNSQLESSDLSNLWACQREIPRSRQHQQHCGFAGIIGASQHVYVLVKFELDCVEWTYIGESKIFYGHKAPYRQGDVCRFRMLTWYGTPGRGSKLIIATRRQLN